MRVIEWLVVQAVICVIWFCGEAECLEECGVLQNGLFWACTLEVWVREWVMPDSARPMEGRPLHSSLLSHLCGGCG